MIEDVLFRVRADVKSFLSAISNIIGQKEGMWATFYRVARAGFVLAGVYSIITRVLRGLSSVIVSVIRTSEEQIKVFSEISILFAELKGITQATTEEAARLNETIIKTGEYFGQSQKEVLMAAKSLATLGITSANAMSKILPQAVKFSLVMDRNVKESAELLLKTMRLFNYTAEESERVIRLLGNSYIKSAANADYLAVSLQYAGFAAKAFNHDLKDILPLLMGLADRGLRASRAGMAIRSAFVKLGAPSQKTLLILRRVGLSYRDISLEQNKMIDVLKKLNKALGGVNFYWKEIFGQRFYAPVRELAKLASASDESSRSLQKYLKMLQDNSAYIAKVEEKLNTIGIAYARLSTATENAAISAGKYMSILRNYDVFLDILTRMKQKSRETFETMAKFPKISLTRLFWQDLRRRAAELPDLETLLMPIKAFILGIWDAIRYNIMSIRVAIQRMLKIVFKLADAFLAAFAPLVGIKYVRKDFDNFEFSLAMISKYLYEVSFIVSTVLIRAFEKFSHVLQLFERVENIFKSIRTGIYTVMNILSRLIYTVLWNGLKGIGSILKGDILYGLNLIKEASISLIEIWRRPMKGLTEFETATKKGQPQPTLKQLATKYLLNTILFWLETAMGSRINLPPIGGLTKSTTLGNLTMGLLADYLVGVPQTTTQYNVTNHNYNVTSKYEANKELNLGLEF